LLVFVEGGRETEGCGVLFRDDDMGELSGGGFGKGREAFFEANETGGVVKVLVWGGAARRDRQLVRLLV